MKALNILQGMSILLTMLLLHAGGYSQVSGSLQMSLTKCAERAIEQPAAGILASWPDRVFVGTTNGSLLSFDAVLALVWRSELGGEFASDLIFSDKGVALVTNPSTLTGTPPELSTLRMISRDAGIPLWTARLPYAERYYLFSLAERLIAISNSGAVIEIRTKNGEITRQTAANAILAATPSLSLQGEVLFGTQDKRLWSYSTATGQLALRNTLEHLSTAVTLKSDGGYAVGDDRGNLSLYSSEGRRPGWRFKGGAAITSVKEVDEGLLVSSLDNFVYLLSDYNGNVIWKRRLSGRVLDAGAIVQGHYVALVPSENSVFALGLEKGVVSDVILNSERDFVSKAPVPFNGRSFLIALADIIELYSFGGCEGK